MHYGEMPWATLGSSDLRTKHTNLTLLNERQNNVTSCTNCPYLISTFIPLDVDKFGAFFFYCFSTFCQLNVFFQIRVIGLKFNKIFFFEYRKYLHVTSNYKSDRPYVNIWGQLKNLEISKYKRESKGRIGIFVLFLLIVVLFVFLNIKSVKI
jgi:hypothetical protein